MEESFSPPLKEECSQFREATLGLIKFVTEKPPNPNKLTKLKYKMSTDRTREKNQERKSDLHKIFLNNLHEVFCHCK